jgi:hypothetical protein
MMAAPEESGFYTCGSHSQSRRQQQQPRRTRKAKMPTTSFMKFLTAGSSRYKMVLASKLAGLHRSASLKLPPLHASSQREDRAAVPDRTWFTRLLYLLEKPNPASNRKKKAKLSSLDSLLSLEL